MWGRDCVVCGLPVPWFLYKAKRTDTPWEIDCFRLFVVSEAHGNCWRTRKRRDEPLQIGIGITIFGSVKQVVMVNLLDEMSKMRKRTNRQERSYP
jgi:hypothetical protein